MRVFFITTLTFNLVTCLLEANIYAQDYAEVEWIRKYIGPDSINAAPKALEIDKHGNVYVVIDDVSSSSGTDYVIVKYDSIGNEEWIARFAGVGQWTTDWVEKVVVDQDGNVYATGNTSVPEFYTTVKYDPNGVLQWAATANTADPSLSTPRGLSIDDSGNVYVAILSRDLFKYDHNGNQVWRRSDTAYVYSMTLDDNANIYLAGSDFVKKYNSNGMEQWVISDTLEPRSILVHNNDNVYVCGRKGLSKLSSEGVRKWSTIHGAGFYLVDYMTLDDAGNPVVAGRYADAYYPEYFGTIEYDTNGTKLWEAFYRGPQFGRYVQEPTDICSDRLGNIYVIGYSTGDDGTSNVTTVKYSASGEQKWVMRYGNARAQFIFERPTIAVKVDSAGNVYVSGVNVFRDNYYIETFVIKYRQPNFMTSVNSENSNPDIFSLFQNYPNPFNPETTIKYQLPKETHTQIEIVNLLGQVIRILIDERKPPGVYTTVWDGRLNNKRSAAPGVYFCRMRTEEFEKTTKLLLLR